MAHHPISLALALTFGSHFATYNNRKLVNNENNLASTHTHTLAHTPAGRYTVRLPVAGCQALRQAEASSPQSAAAATSATTKATAAH